MTGHGVQERVDEPGAAGSEEEAAGVESTIGGGDDLEESVAPSFPPPMATRQEVNGRFCQLGCRQ